MKCSFRIGKLGETQRSAEDILKGYVHNAKSEVVCYCFKTNIWFLKHFQDARYTTTGNEIGKRVPTVATFVAER